MGVELGCLRGLKRQCHSASWTQGSSSERKAKLEGQIWESRWWAWICAQCQNIGGTHGGQHNEKVGTSLLMSSGEESELERWQKEQKAGGGEGAAARGRPFQKRDGSSSITLQLPRTSAQDEAWNT